MQNQTPPIIDPLQIKIEKAKAELPAVAQSAINSVDWRSVVLGMKEKRGYSYSQLEDLEIETELLLCGLVNPKDYPKELTERMKLPKTEVDLLLNELNELIFKKIREKLMESEKNNSSKNSPLEEYPLGGGGQIFHPGVNATPQEGNALKDSENKQNTEIFGGAGIEITKPTPIIEKESAMEKRDDMLEKVENPNLISQKLSGSFQIPTVKTEYSLPSLGGNKTIPVSSEKINASKTDPYRMMPE